MPRRQMNVHLLPLTFIHKSLGIPLRHLAYVHERVQEVHKL